MTGKQALKVENIVKAFPGTIALDDVDFHVNYGEIVGLVGENGAGKSTLMNIIGGVLPQDSGVIKVDDEEVTFKSPLDAERYGIGYIHQELELFPSMTIAENIGMNQIAGMNLTKIVSFKEMVKNSSALLKQLGLEINPRTSVEALSYAEKTIVEIAKAMYKDAKVIIFDEPTSALTDQEKENLFKIINDLKSRNRAVIFISHHLKEVLEICDRIVVLRDGLKVGSLEKAEFDENKVIRFMIGRKLENKIYESYVDAEQGEVVFGVEKLSLDRRFKDISFDLKRGEVLGITGLLGSGKAHLARTLFGMHTDYDGAIKIDNEVVNLKSPKEAKGAGLGFISSDRHGEGLVLIMSVADNISLTLLQNLRKRLSIDEKLESEIVDSAIAELSIKVHTPQQIVNNLSGGNQQKVVISKWLATKPKILILEEPTRGIDVGTKAEVHRIIRDLANKGTSIMLITSELEELQDISDRIIVLFNGEIAGELDRKEFSQERIMQYASIGE